jgi:hypothetical protein
MAKCWWVGRNTFDKTSANQFEKLDILGSRDISTKISDIFYSNTFVSNPSILDGIIFGIKYFKDERTQLSVREHIRPALQLLNAIGGGLVLDCLSSEDIADIFVENVYGIIQGDIQGIDFADSSGLEYVNEDKVEFETNRHDEEYNDDDIGYVSLGQKLVVRYNSTGDEKVLMIDYSNQSGNIPGLAKELLGKAIGDEIDYLGKSYTILRTIR